MKYRLLAAVCLALVVLVQCAAFAQQGGYVKYIQQPKMSLSYDFASEFNAGYVMADDWLCADGNPVTDIHWWGSYWTALSGGGFVAYSDMRPNAQSGGIESFTIAILSDVPADDPNNQLGFSYPGDLLATYEFDGDCNETRYGTVVKSRNPDGSPRIVEEVYEYSVDLTNTQFGPFNQERGEIYWLAVVANLPDESRQWGWHEADGHWVDYAVQGFIGEEGPSDWYIPCTGHDMAFALTAVPEPGSLLALGAGLTGMVGFAVRKRKRAA